MNAFSKFRIPIAVSILAAVYWLLLDYTLAIYHEHSLTLAAIRYLRAHHIPIGAWIYPLYVLAILMAALPVAIACVALGTDKAVRRAAFAGAVAPALYLVQMFWLIPGSVLWRGDGPVRLVLEQVVLFGAAPALALLLQKSSRNLRLGRTRDVFAKYRQVAKTWLQRQFAIRHAVK